MIVTRVTINQIEDGLPLLTNNLETTHPVEILHQMLEGGIEEMTIKIKHPQNEKHPQTEKIRELIGPINAD